MKGRVPPRPPYNLSTDCNLFTLHLVKETFLKRGLLECKPFVLFSVRLRYFVLHPLTLLV